MAQLTGAGPLAGRTAAPSETSATVDRALRRREEQTLARVTIVRTAMLVIVGLWLVANYGYAVVADSLASLALFIAAGLLHYALRRRSTHEAIPYAFILFDCMLLTWTLLAPGRTYPEAGPGRWSCASRASSTAIFS